MGESSGCQYSPQGPTAVPSEDPPGKRVVLSIYHQRALHSK